MGKSTCVVFLVCLSFGLAHNQEFAVHGCFGGWFNIIQCGRGTINITRTQYGKSHCAAPNTCCPNAGDCRLDQPVDTTCTTDSCQVIGPVSERHLRCSTSGVASEVSDYVLINYTCTSFPEGMHGESITETEGMELTTKNNYADTFDNSLIIGVSVAGAVFLVLAVVLVCLCRRLRQGKKSRHTDESRDADVTDDHPYDEITADDKCANNPTCEKTVPAAAEYESIDEVKGNGVVASDVKPGTNENGSAKGSGAVYKNSMEVSTKATASEASVGPRGDEYAVVNKHRPSAGKTADSDKAEDTGVEYYNVVDSTRESANNIKKAAPPAKPTSAKPHRHTDNTKSGGQINRATVITSTGKDSSGKPLIPKEKPKLVNGKPKVAAKPVSLTGTDPSELKSPAVSGNQQKSSSNPSAVKGSQDPVNQDPADSASDDDDIYDTSQPADPRLVSHPTRFEPRFAPFASVEDASRDYDYAYSHVPASGPMVTVRDRPGGGGGEAAGTGESDSGAAYAEIGGPETPPAGAGRTRVKGDEYETVMAENVNYG